MWRHDHRPLNFAGGDEFVGHSQEALVVAAVEHHPAVLVENALAPQCLNAARAVRFFWERGIRIQSDRLLQPAKPVWVHWVPLEDVKTVVVLAPKCNQPAGAP